MRHKDKTREEILKEKRDYAREFYRKNRDRLLEKTKKWRAENPEKLRAYHFEKYAKNAEKIREKVRQHTKKYWLEKSYGTLKTRAKGGPCATLEEVRDLYKSQNGLCAFSFLPIHRGTAHLDHKMPISRGGSHTIENLQWLHKQINWMKNDMSMPEFVDIFNRVVASRGSAS